MRRTRHDPERGFRVLVFIEDFREQHGYAPSVQEITTGVGLRSKAATAHHLARLERDGLLTRTPGVARSYRAAQDPGVCGSCGRGW